MLKEKVVYTVYRPDGRPYTQFNTRKKAKAFINDKNSAIDDYDYGNLWKIGASVKLVEIREDE